MRTKRTTLALALALPLAAAACSARTPADPPPDGGGASPGLCPRPGGEFAAGGCAVVRGRVLGSRGQPVPGTGLSAGLAPREGCTACNAPGLPIDGEGRFGQTVHWFSTDPPDSAVALVHVAATGPGYPIEGDRPAYRDSARVVLRFAPTGEAARPAAEVTLRLPIP